MRRAALAAAVLLLALPAAAQAAPSLVPVGGTFDQPVHVSGPPGDGSRVFVVEQTGRVQLVVDGQRAPTPFLDLSGSVAPAYERGLLSIAFAPDYATSGLFYVFFTANAGAAPSGATGDLVVMEGRRSDANPNVADPAHRRVVFSIPHPGDNHNGGQLAFGPDGALYASTGDGGGLGDREDAQRPGSLLGKILRVDPRSGAAPTVWALGLRNPWRFSFDRSTGDIYIGDVGEGTWEEIDRGPAGVAGRNYGWPACEGPNPTPCTIAGAQPPIIPLDSNQGYHSVVGGVVVRDPGVPSLLGRYVFGDHFVDPLHSAAPDGSDVKQEALSVDGMTAVSEDGCGHVHIASLGGTVQRIQDGAPGPCVVPQTTPPPPPGGGGGPPPVVDERGCGITVRGQKRTQRILRRGKRLKLRLRSDEACTVILRAKRFRTKTVVLPAGDTRTVRLKASKRGLRKLRRQLARSDKPRLRVTVRISARDTAGNFTIRRVKPRVR